jgi:hypothetical protein
MGRLMEITNKFESETKELINVCSEKMLEEDRFLNMESDEIVMLHSAMKLLDSALKLTVEWSRTMDEQNRKLDKLMEKFDRLKIES